jgi:hypothetical protein
MKILLLRGIFFSTVFTLLFTGKNYGQVQTPHFNTSVVPNSGGFYDYLPVNYNAPGNTQKYPLICFSQGLGELGNGSEGELPKILWVGLPALINNGAFPATFTVNGETFSFIVISPQFRQAPSVADWQAYINYAVQNYRVDVNRIYMTGLSNGGGMSWEYPSSSPSYANRLAAIVPICGSTWPSPARARIIADANLAVWATHCDLDPIWSVQSTIGWIDQINTVPLPNPLAKKTIFLNSPTHDAWTPTYTPGFKEDGKNIYEWMLQYKRNFVGTNQVPYAIAGGNYNLGLPNNSALMNGSSSWDPDGSIAAYNWTWKSGPTQYTINNPNAATPLISNLTEGRYVFQLAVTDNGGAVGTDTTVITVAPVIKPIPGKIEAENYTTMSGVATEAAIDSGGALNVSNIDNADWMDYNVNVAYSGPYYVKFRLAAYSSGAQFQLRKSDGSVLTTVTVPQTSAWQTWTTVTTGNINLTAGNQTLRVYSNNTVNWNFNWMDFVAVDQSPVANAGPPQVIITPASQVTLTGSGTPNTGGTIASYAWSQISGTAATITNPASATTTVTGLVDVGVRIFRLTVTDNQGRTGSANVTVTVNAPGPPTANAGGIQTILLPTSQVTLTGSGTANNGGTITFAWSQVSGTAATITSPTLSTTTVTGLTTTGTRVFRLTVTDNDGGTATSDVTITVNPANLSTPYGGTRRTIPGKLEAEEYDNGGQNIAYVDGTATNLGAAFRPTEAVDVRSCPDVGGGYCIGWTTDGEWMKYSVNVTTTGLYTFTVRAGTPNTGKTVQFQVDGTTVASITILNTGGYNNWQTSTLNNVQLTAGDHTFRFMVVTGDASNPDLGFDINWFNFDLTSNQSPSANAGLPQSITLPVNQVVLNGTGIANNGGSITNYTWTQISGVTAVIASPLSASTNITGLYSSGIRVFRLTVADNQGNTATSDVTITVNPSGGLPVVTTNAPQSIATVTASLTSTATAAAGIASTKWTKFSVPGQSIKTVTVIGSSTAAGNGTTSVDSTFVNRLKAYYISKGIITNITNLAVAGTTPFDINITTALNYGSNILLVSYPSNGYTASTNAAVVARFQQIKDSCTNRGVQFYLTGTQPRNDFSPADRANLITLNSLLRSTFGANFIDVLAPLLNTADNSINPEFNADGIHPNDAGHEKIYQLVRAVNIFQNLISSPSVITTPTTANTTITGLTQGIHQYQVSVIDNAGFAASAVAMITSTITPPTVSAGTAQTITIPVTTVTLTGTASGNNGTTITNYAWTQVGGVAGTITSPSTATTTVTGLTTIGARVFRLTVTDNNGSTASSDVTITVNPFSDGKTIPGKIEGENWDAKSGGMYAVATNDVGGGQHVVGIALNNYMDYYVNVVVSGTYTVSFRVATSQANARFQLKLGTTVLGTVVVPNTGGWGTWATVAVTNVSLTAGTQTLRVLSTNSESCNFNWMDYVANNQPPTASAGTNQTVHLPTSQVTLTGTGSTPNAGGTITYAWTRVSGPNTSPALTIVSPTSATTDVTGLIQGVYVFRLTVTDNTGGTATSDVTITVNQPPTANAGTNQAITLPTNQATLTGTGTANNGGTITYAWTQVSGTAAAITTPSAASTTITGLTTIGARVFRLTVTDNLGGATTSDVIVTVNPGPPVANAGTPQHIISPVAQVTLTGTGTANNGGTITYGWTRISGPNDAPALSIISPASSTTNVTGLIEGVYVFRLTVTDNDGGTATSDVTITVSLPPTANAGTNQTIILPTSQVTLTGTGAANNGGTITYAWTRISGPNTTPALAIVTPTAASTLVTGLIEGVYVFRLTVTDNDGGTTASNVTITVNRPPTANAGANQTIILPASQVTLTGTGVANNGGTITYGWTRVSGPNDAPALSIVSPTAAGTLVTGLVEGVYVFRLTVTDNDGGATTSNVTITVIPPGPPTANAGANQTIILPANQVTLNGTGAANNGGTIADYAWTQVSGTAATITSPSLASTTVTGLTTAGIRVFRLTVTDNGGATATSDVAITVNQPPTANAGTNQTIILPTNQVALTGTGAANNGGTITFAWTQVSGTAAVITSASTASTTVTGLTTAGARVFRLTVTDNDGGVTTSDVTITVILPPTANAGSAQTIQLPLSQVTLAGTGVAGNAGALTYAWSQVSGTAATITNPSLASTTVTGLGTTGARVFRLTVTENGGGTATSDVTVTVNPSTPPIANAGTTQTVQLPTSQVTLTGTGTATNGGTLTYGWTQLSGTAATITNPSSASTTVTGMTTVGARVFRLTVTESTGGTATSDVTINVNPAANGKTIPGKIEAEAWDGRSGGFYAVTSTDVGGGQQVIGIAINNYMDYNVYVATSGSYTVNFRIATTQSNAKYQLKLGATVLATVNIPNTGGWGTWVTVPVSNVILTAGTQTLRVVSINSESANFNWMDYVLDNQPPTANAGSAQTITLPLSQVTLSGTGASNNGGTISYAWSQVSGTAATITSPSLASTTVTGLTTAGVRVFRLTVTRDDNQTATSDVTITVNPVPAPTANAGTNQTIALPANQVSLTGTGAANNGGTITYGWSQVSGTVATITSPSLASTTITGLTTSGVRVFRLTVTRDDNQTATSDVTITVNPAPPPTANAGTNQTILLPASQVTLNGTATANNGGTVTVAWTRVSGPNNTPALSIVSPTATSTLVTGLIQGTYVFRLTVTQNDLQTATSDVTVNVNPVTPPTAIAGSAQTIVLPTSTVTLSGSGTVGNGGAIVYGWSQVSGTAATITSPSLASTTVTGLTTAGVRVFRLTVTQSDNQTATSDVTITVSAPSNGKTIPGKIEAEAWDGRSGGFYAVPTSDVGGGQQVIGIAFNNYMDFNVTVLTTGTYSVGFRVATTQNNSQFQIKLGAAVLATVSIPNSFGWGNWTTVTVNNVALTAGAQTLRIQSTNTESCNFNWMDFASTGGGTVNMGIRIAEEQPAVSPEKPSSLSWVKIFPNPVTDQFILQADNDIAGAMKVQIVDMRGNTVKEVQVVKNKGLTQLSLSSAGIPAGSYIIRLQMGDWSNTVRMIKL